MDSQTAQNVFAAIQAFGAVVFCGSVIYDASVRKKSRERERRENLIGGLARLYVYKEGINVGLTEEERSGFYSARQIEFFNSELRKRGEKWTYPF
jgi:hypothetical protein